MKLVERVLDNISSEEVSELGANFNLPASQMFSILNTIIPGTLSAFKAQIVSSMNSGDFSSLLSLILSQNTQESPEVELLFNHNQHALDILYQRVSEFNNLDLKQSIIITHAAMPTVFCAIKEMLQEFSVSAIMAPEDDYIHQLITHENGYEKAICAANDFISSVFKININDPKQNTSSQESDNINIGGDDLVQRLYDLFDQDNDGSVMDDIYLMLVRP